MTENQPYQERTLFRLIAEGDEQAFAALFQLYLPKLTAFALRLTQDQEAARDVVQETFVQLWLGREKLEAVDHPAGWLFTICSKQAYKYLRRRMIKENPLLAKELGEAPADTIGLQELKSLLQHAVDGLSAQRKKIFILSRNQGMTIPEIATQLGLSHSTVKNTLVSALQQVRAQLESQGYLLPSLLLFLH